MLFAQNPLFTPLKLPENLPPISYGFELHDEPTPICLIAAAHLQDYLHHQTDWRHNFGLSGQNSGKIIGKMFGVLIVKNIAGEIGYLAAFSGKLAGGNHHPRFVPPVFDTLKPNNFVNQGMTVLSILNREIKELGDNKSDGYKNKINELKQARHKHSSSLQKKIFDQYFFLNKAGESKSLRKIFANANYKNPPSGAGECAGPKLLQYAFQHQMEPIALTEFWWGMSPKSNHWQHGHFYSCCEEKCAPILKHMLKDIDQQLARFPK